MTVPTGDAVWTACWAAWKAKADYREDIEQHAREREPLHRWILASRPPESARWRVLEVGCGTAIDACVIAEDPQAFVVGSDRDAGAIVVAQRIAASFVHRPHFLVDDAAALSFPDATFDLVFSQGFLEHFRDPLPYLREQVRVLKPSGYLIIDVPQTFAGFGLYSLRKQWKIHRGTWPWGWETQYSYPALRRLGASVGLVSCGVAGYGFDGLLNLFANPHVMIDKHRWLGRWPLAQVFKRWYLRSLRDPNERVWRWVCSHWGHWLLICLVVRFRKTSACA